MHRGARARTRVRTCTRARRRIDRPLPGPRLWYMTCIVVCMHTQLRDCGGVADYSLRAPSDPILIPLPGYSCARAPDHGGTRALHMYAHAACSEFESIFNYIIIYI